MNIHTEDKKYILSFPSFESNKKNNIYELSEHVEPTIAWRRFYYNFVYMDIFPVRVLQARIDQTWILSMYSGSPLSIEVLQYYQHVYVILRSYGDMTTLNNK